MIKRLRNRFIRIAMLSVTAVMMLLTIILNVANYVSTDSDLKQTLTLIYENAGTIPHSRFLPPSGSDSADAPTPPENDGGSGDTAPAPPDGADDSQTPQAPPDDKIARREGPFTAETPFSTRFFVLHYTSSGTLIQADLDNIASVTEDDTQEYLSAALAHGAGYGYFNSYRFFVAQTDDGKNIAIFLDCYHELRAMRVVLMWSLLADAACILLVFLLVVLLSRRAIDPVVRSAQQQKQFITDASHELKTPITVIATSLKVLEMETGKQKWIDKAMAQTEKLTSLVNSLVTLSRMDEEDSPLRMEEFPVSDAVRETAETFVDFAASKGHELRLSITDGLTYRGDEYAVRQLVSILLDNAVKYALPDSPIEFSLEKAKRGVVLRSSNACEDVAPENAQKLFDRFTVPINPARRAAALASAFPSRARSPRGTTAPSAPSWTTGRSPSPPSSNKRLLGKKTLRRTSAKHFSYQRLSSPPVTVSMAQAINFFAAGEASLSDGTEMPSVTNCGGSNGTSATVPLHLREMSRWLKLTPSPASTML